MKAVDLRKQKALEAGPKAMQQINFTGNPVQDPITNITMFLIIEQANRNNFRFFTRNCESIIISFCFNIISI